MMVAASTGGGKVWFVKSLLENREQWISPAPQQIMLIYGQWQPLYAEMHKIIPCIEFVKGIPANTEDGLRTQNCLFDRDDNKTVDKKSMNC